MLSFLFLAGAAALAPAPASSPHATASAVSSNHAGQQVSRQMPGRPDVHGSENSHPALDAAARRDVVHAAANLLRDEYVFPDVGRRAAMAISHKLALGRYDALRDPRAFAKQLNVDLNAVAHDKHLRVYIDGQGPDDNDQDGPPPRSELGFSRVDVLDGNIGYVDLTGFVPKGMFKPEADKVMRLLAGSEALIIDLRRNGGGDPASVAYLASFFFEPKTPVHLNDLLWRKRGTEEYRREVFQTEPTPLSYLGKPIVLLTGPHTFSGGEEFAYDMKSLKLASLVGEVTGGGANPGDDKPLKAGLHMFLPTGKAENPITHTNWEGRGVEPDIRSSSDQVFGVAYNRVRRTTAAKDLVAGAPSGPDAVVERRLLLPRTRAQRDSEAAVRRSVAEFQEGAPRYDLLSPYLVELTRTQLPRIHTDVAALGALQSVTFVEVGPMGDDHYDLKFEKGEWLWSVLVADDGKIIMAGFRPK